MSEGFEEGNFREIREYYDDLLNIYEEVLVDDEWRVLMAEIVC